MSARAIGALGLASFALILVAGLVEPLWDMPGTGAAPAEVSAYVAANRDGFLVTLFAYSLAMGLFLAFAAGLSTLLRGAGRSNDAAVAMFAAGSVALVAVVLAGFVPVSVVAYRELDPASARDLYDLTFGLLAISGVPTAVALGAYAAIVLGRGPLPRWTGLLAVAGAAAHVLIAATFLFSDGFLSLEGGVIVAVPATLFLWLAAVSAVLVRRPG